MKISLIITTYNRADALRICLQSAMAQNRMADEIIVADDGSSDNTRATVSSFAAACPVPVHFCWQEDLGFRAARLRNLALARAVGDYMVFVDGDMMLHRDFVGDHETFAAAGLFLQGSRVLLDARRTAMLLAGGRTDISIFDRGLGNRKNCLRLPALARFFSGPMQQMAGIRTCNFSFWRRDALAVNGFNEDFVGWGREDSEFAARLFNSGVTRRNLKFVALGYHLHHPENDRQSLAQNDRILAQTIGARLSWCENGLRNHLGSHAGSEQPQLSASA